MFDYVLIVCPFLKILFKLFDLYIILKKIILSFFFTKYILIQLFQPNKI